MNMKQCDSCSRIVYNLTDEELAGTVMCKECRVNPIQARERVKLHKCPDPNCEGWETTHDAYNACQGFDYPQVDWDARVEEFVPLSHVQSLEAEVERLREVLGEIAAGYDRYHRDGDLKRLANAASLARAALDTTTEGGDDG